MLHIAEPRTLRSTVRHSGLSLVDITGEASKLEDFDNHEQIWLGRDDDRGLTAIVAVHSTLLGPALGGTRVWPHENLEAALTDALRLSSGMTAKAAICGVPFGGGKAVIIADPRSADPKIGKTPALLEAYAEMLAALAGQYVTAEDVGLTLADADFLGDRAPNVAGTTKGGSGNPSPVTAHGVFLGLKAAQKHRSGSGKLDGVRIGVQGLGAVGMTLCDKLHAEGARLVAGDIDAARAEKARQAFAAEIVAPDAVLAADIDIFAPCALGGVLSTDTIPALKAGIVAGSANNQLATHEDAHRLRENGVLYAPDYVINAAGLINVASELAPDGYDRAAVAAKVEEIPATLAAIFARAEAQDRTTDEIAEELAAERLAAAAAG